MVKGAGAERVGMYQAACSVPMQKGRPFSGNLLKKPVKELNFPVNMQTCNYRHNYVREYFAARLFKRLI